MMNLINSVRLLFSLCVMTSWASEKTFIFVGHGLRCNESVCEIPLIKDLFAPGLPIYATNGPDHIPQHIERTITPKYRANKPFLEQIYLRLYSELILFAALRRASIGQGEDIHRVHQRIADAGLKTENGIYFGFSKGGGLGANLLSINKWKGAVLIAPICNVNLAFGDFPPLSKLPQTPLFNSYLIPCLRHLILTQYKTGGVQPLDLSRSTINKKTPILIVSINKDTLVPQFHQFMLYMKLKTAGFNVYFHEIQHGTHYKLTKKYPDDHATLVDVVQRFQKSILTESSHIINDTSPPVSSIAALMDTRFPGLTMAKIEDRIRACDWSKSYVPGFVRLTLATLAAYQLVKYIHHRTEKKS